MSFRMPEGDDDSFKRPGSVPFNWEIQPGVPKHTNSTSQHRRCLPQQLSPPPAMLSPSQSPSPPSSLRCFARPSIKHRHAKLSALLRCHSMSDHHAAVGGLTLNCVTGKHASKLEKNIPKKNNRRHTLNKCTLPIVHEDFGA
ncbi:hypothetical protein GW17_00040779 [Ensete ventricosum]|nr:hypothetical protein GW17_00040779 [Ensete ventricosum]